MSSPRRRWVAPGLALVLAGCGGVDEYVPPVLVSDAAVIDGPPPPIDAWVDAPSDGVTALPDIVLVEDLMAGSLRVSEQFFSPTDCAIVEGCVGGSGQRRLLRFSTVTANQGTGDLHLGDPAGNPLFEYSACHDHHHFLGYADYELVDGRGVVVTGSKQAFCLLDSIRMAPDAPPEPRYSCEFQGITAGWADSYPHFLPCQWVDITDVPPGSYTLRITVNPERLLDETDYTNNQLSLPVAL